MVEVIESKEGMEALREGWDALERELHSPLVSFPWFSACARTLCPPLSLKIIVDRDGNRLNAVAPLGVIGKSSPRLEILGSSIVGEPGGFLYRTREALTNVFNAALRLRMPLYLKGLNMYSGEVELLEKEIKAGNLQSMVREERIPWVSIQGNWQDFEKNISPSRRSSFRRLQRLAEKKGEVAFEAVVPTPENIDGYLNEAFEVEAASWKTRKGTAMQSYMELGEFFREYTTQESRSGKMYLFFFRVGGKAVAMGLATLHANRLWIYKIGYDESWSWCSPGVLLMHQMVRYSFEKKFASCEFLGADESWLHIWANESHSMATYRVYPSALSGRLTLATDFLRMSVHKVTTVVSTRLAHKRRTGDAERA